MSPDVAERLVARIEQATLKAAHDHKVETVRAHAQAAAAGDVSVATVGQRFWLSTNEYIVGTGTGKVFVVTLSPASTNSF